MTLPTSRQCLSNRWLVPLACWCRRRVISSACEKICDQHNILLVFDEVITGFGRTGSMFGADSFGVTPDLMCIAKQDHQWRDPHGRGDCQQRDLSDLYEPGDA